MRYTNKFKALPKSVIKLKNLKYLDLSGCSIKSIPEEIFEIKSLEELYLD
ncbi:MAG: leucine-rich repeat domain-containing protein, partial [Candidatus Helarchaeota archaeon]